MKIPNHGARHVAIIMDGNGRWAKKRLLPRVAGHKAGVEAVRTIVRAAGDLGIEAMTLYAFSSENWKRPEEEVSDLMGLMKRFILSDLDEFAANECLAAEPQVGGAGFPVFMGKVMHVSVHFHLHSWVRTVSGIQKFVALWVFGNLDDRLAQDSSATRRRI